MMELLNQCMIDFHRLYTSSLMQANAPLVGKKTSIENYIIVVIMLLEQTATSKYSFECTNVSHVYWPTIKHSRSRKELKCRVYFNYRCKIFNIQLLSYFLDRPVSSWETITSAYFLSQVLFLRHPAPPWTTTVHLPVVTSIAPQISTQSVSALSDKSCGGSILWW